MNEELFPAEDVSMDSPKLKWMKAHGLETELIQKELAPETGYMDDFWVCRTIKPRSGLWTDNEIGSGDTEDEACADLAINRGIKLWFEQ